MATFAFETIGAAEAAAFKATDQLLFQGVSARSVAVLFGLDGTVTLASGGRAVAFGPGVLDASTAGNLTFPDGSTLKAGSSGGDAMGGEGRDDGLYGGAGNDTLNGGEGANLLQGNQGADQLVAGAGDDIFYGGQDGDLIRTGDGRNFAQGNLGGDTIEGGTGSDTVLGGQGADVLSGDLGDDFLNGNLGDDCITGGDGNDRIFGEAGDDYILVGYESNGLPPGNDTVSGGDGNDRIIGSISDDSAVSVLMGDDGDDAISANRGTLTIDGGAGNDAISLASPLRALVTCGDGDDVFQAFHGANTIDGGAGNDRIMGGDDAETINGGAGLDTLSGGRGPDRLEGGAGADLFVVTRFDTLVSYPVTNVPELSGADRIVDWSAEDKFFFEFKNAVLAASQYVEITAASADDAYAQARQLMAGGEVLYVAAQAGADVILFAWTYKAVTVGTDQAIILQGRSLADISFANIT